MTEYQDPASQSTDSELPFRLLQDRYEMIEAIGAGGMGTVYHAHDPVLSRDVAIKLLSWDIAPTPEQVQRMQREAQALARLKHPNILGIFDFVMDEENRPFLIMEFIRGEGLDSILKKEGPLSLFNAAAVAAQICEGMSHAHSEGLLHRDLKPSNILLEDSETELPVKIIDLGLAKLSADDQALTKTGIAMGSPPYMSPEQARGLPLEPSSDIYSLGCVLFQMLTGVPPFTGTSALEVISKHLSEAPPKLSDAREHKAFPQSLEDLVAKCLAKESTNRYQTMDELKAVLYDLMAGEELVLLDSDEQPDNEGEEQGKASKPLVILLCAIGVCVATAVFWLGYLQQQPDVPIKPIAKEFDRKLTIDKLEDGFPSYERETYRGMDTLKIYKENGLSAAGKKGEKDFRAIRFKPQTDDLSGKGLAFFKNEPIDYVYAAKSALTDEGARELSQIKSVRSLDLNETEKLSEKGFINLLSALPNLESLSFGSDTTTIDSFKAVSRLRNLQKLMIRSRRRPLPKQFGNELIKLKSITCLTLDDCMGLDENQLKELLPLRSLERIALKSQKVSIPMIKVLSRLAATYYTFEDCTMSAGTFAELAKKRGVKISIDVSTTGDIGEISDLTAKGVLQKY